MKTRLLTSILLILGMLKSFAQVPKTIVVEHFTNTRCSVCASRNPGFYNNLKQEPATLHVAFHPSSPYSSCLLNKHNTVENDARTKFYGVYGATPRLVIQGNVISGSVDYDNQSLFTPYRNLTSPFAMKTLLRDRGDSLQVSVTVKTVAPHSFSSLLLFASALEEELIYQAPNGEALHHDVFRQSFWNIEGTSFTPSLSVGDSVVLTKAIAKRPEWNLSQLYALSIVQQSNKQIEQAARSESAQPSTGLTLLSTKNAEIYPNPSYGNITVELKDSQPTDIKVIDITGKTRYQTTVTATSTLHLSELTTGIYYVQTSNNNGSFLSKISLIQ